MKPKFEERTIADLAEEVGTKRKSKKSFFVVPFVIVIPVLFVITLAASILPSIITMSNSATAAIDEATGRLVWATVKYASSSLQQQMKAIMDGTAMVAENPVISNLMQREVYNYGANAEINLFMAKYNNITGLGTACYQRENLTGLMTQPAKPNFYNLTYYTVVPTGDVCWVDYNNTASFCAKVDRTTGKRDSNFFPNPYVPFDNPAQTSKFTLASIMYNCPPDGAWSAALVYNDTWLAYARCPYARSGAIAPYMCLTAQKQDPNFFQFTSSTQKSRIFLLANENQLILANSNVEIANKTKSGIVEVSQANDTIIAELGAKLIEKYGGGISKFPEFTVSQIQNFAANSEVMYSVKVNADGGEEWVTTIYKYKLGDQSFALIVSVPRYQFTGGIEASKRSGVILTAIFAVFGALLGVLATFFAILPLKKISSNMAKATNFDFTMIENGEFDESNLFSEIRNLQRTFNTMIKAFAIGIRNSRALQSSRSQPTVSPSSSYDYGSHQMRDFDNQGRVLGTSVGTYKQKW
ncbi:hypothetical protein HK098_004144 [Nowakowskiella sp. JEL0407]|nr:hypothetical protein HK098_004144 [Nowakowskiella sp. JEL0407]